ncbi:MAG: TIR domain-containing protein [Campylobacteraceae bacterium]|nr:TIR domain-containing protein [Campylobacteraceae bacterium]
MSNKQNVFISYHHDKDASNKNDTQYKEDFIKMYLMNEDISISTSLHGNDEKSSTVTVVLIGNDSWQKKYIDSEISFSLEESITKARSGLIGIVLPSYKEKMAQGSFPYYGQINLENSSYCIDEKIIPERLSMNIKNGFVKIYDWSNNPDEVETWIQEAYQRSINIEPEVS